MWHNWAPIKGLEVKAEIEELRTERQSMKHWIELIELY